MSDIMNMKKSYCKVPGCSGLSQLVRFPRNRLIGKQWLDAISNPCLNRMHFAQLIRGRRICVDHFEEKYFDKHSTIVNKILLPGAVPTLNLPGQPSRIKCLAHLDWDLDSNAQTVQVVVNKPFQRLLKDEILNLMSIERYCVLLFKIVPLRPHLKYNSKNDVILGFQNANETVNQGLYAECALLFMVCGLYTNWKQLISFVFCAKNMSSQVLTQSIKDVLETCNRLRLKVIATVCDQSDCNLRAMAHLKSEMHAHCLHSEDELGYDHFYRDSREILILYDFPELIQQICKEFKMNAIEFLIGDVKYTAQFSDIILYRKTHSINNDLNILNVELATGMLDSFAATGTFLHFFIELSDSLSGVDNEKPLLNPLKCTVNSQSKHCDVWERSIDILNSMSFVHSNALKTQSTCLKKIISTLHGIIHLWRGVLIRNHFQTFTPKFLRLEPLKNDIRRLKVISNSHLRFDITKSGQFTMNSNEFFKSFRKIMTNVPDTGVPLCDATRPLILSMCKAFSKCSFSNNDYRPFDQLLNKTCKTLLTQPAFYAVKYEPKLNFNNKPMMLSSSNKAFFPIRTVSKCVAAKLSAILDKNHCDVCNSIFEFESVFQLKRSKHFAQAFWLVAVFLKYKLPKMYNKTNLNATLVNEILESGFVSFLNCKIHKLDETFVDVCVSKIILSWVKKLNGILLSTNKYSMLNSDYFSKQATLTSFKWRRNKRNTFSLHG